MAVTDPFNKVYVERALEGISYDKAFDGSRGITYYRLKNSRRDGAEFCEKLGGILRGNGMRWGFEPLEKNDGNLLLHDEVPENA